MARATHGSSPLARGLRVSYIAWLNHARIIPARAGFTYRTVSTQHDPQDHPRSRGVYRDPLVEPVTRDGSSPLARGLRLEDLGRGGGLRIIPARAGFTRAGHNPLLGVGDHPRSRGVYRRARVGRSSASGSSPLARGLRPRPHGLREVVGIIPARAGFTPSTRRRHGGSRDHPRSRGVYPSTSIWWCMLFVDHPRSRGVYRRRTPRRLTSSGSSPLARGLPRPGLAPGTQLGIIPARAGFTCPEVRAILHWRDHPRSRGVYRRCRRCSGGTGGSSPLARGLLRAAFVVPLVVRIIPARAGFTVASGPGGGWPWDHPRSRGVYARRSSRSPSSWGSSPLARGLHGLLLGLGAAGRIIPARAGFTDATAPSPGESEDHPRSRGVYSRRASVRITRYGSSPLARGLQYERNGYPQDRWIIPARAGFTRRWPGRPPDPRDHPRSRGVYGTIGKEPQ